jgi:hypothetical protein
MLSLKFVFLSFYFLYQMIYICSWVPVSFFLPRPFNKNTAQSHEDFFARKLILKFFNFLATY